ncbi:MAG: hemolysin family protein [Candidatus Binatia bacterium]
MGSDPFFRERVGQCLVPEPDSLRISSPRQGLMYFELLIVFALILVNGLFAGAEIAIVSLRRSRLRQLVESDRKGAAAVAALRAHPERFLATVQIGITVIGATAAAFGGHTIAVRLEPAIASVTGLEEKAEEISLAVVVVVISYFSLVLGELVPKSLALRGAEFFALVLARPLQALSWAARPLVWFLTASSNLVLRPFADSTNFIETRISTEELQQMVEEAAETGALDEHAGEIVSRALEFDKLTLGDVMLPRERVDALPLDADSDRIRRFLHERRRSRIPVYDGSIDNVVGYVTAKDILSRAFDRKAIALGDLLLPVKIFPEAVLAIDVLLFMRRERSRIAIAVDEHGALAGMVTFEDMIEELVGEVFSEHEEEVEPVLRDTDGSLVVRGEVPVRELNREFDLDLEEGPDFRTMGGLCIHLAGGIPGRGARLAANDGVVLVVLDATARSVRRVKILEPAAGPADGEDTQEPAN